MLRRGCRANALNLGQEGRGEAIESAKVRFGEKSASEAARRLIERGLDPSWEVEGTPGEVARTILLGVLGKYHQGALLTREEWSFVATQAQEAFLYADHQRTFVTGELVRDVLGAFKACLHLRHRALGIEELDSDGYFRTKLSIDPSESIPDGVDRVMRSIGLRCECSWAEFVSRPLATFLRNEGSSLPDAALNQELRPFLKSLLLLAVRGYVIRNEQPLLPPLMQAQPQAKSEFGERFVVEGLSMQAIDRGNGMTLLVDLGSFCPVLVTFSDPIEIMDFLELLNWASETGVRGAAKAGTIEIYAESPGDPQTMLILDRVRVFIPTSVLTSLKELVARVSNTKQVGAPLERLQFVYGAM